VVFTLSEGSESVRFECQQCGACCRNSDLVITLNGVDVVRIADALSLGVNDMLRVVDFLLLGEGVRRPKGLEGTPAIATERGLAFLALRKLKNGHCVFLEDDLCMIHPARPSVCRSFPFVFRRDEKSTYWGLSAKKEICPGLGEGPEVSESELSVLANEILDSMDSYREFASEWNAGEAYPTAARLLSAIISDSRFAV
jgi:Fe-S-cluster containining protein